MPIQVNDSPFLGYGQKSMDSATATNLCNYASGFISAILTQAGKGQSVSMHPQIHDWLLSLKTIVTR